MMETTPDYVIHDALWRSLTREDFGWLDLAITGTVALANATFPSVGNQKGHDVIYISTPAMWAFASFLAAGMTGILLTIARNNRQ